MAADSASQTLAGTGAWQRVATVSWTPAADRTGVVLALYRAASGSADAVSLSLDDAVVWDNSTPDLAVPLSETVYDLDSRVVASVMPPGAPATDEPLVTRTARDVLGRPTGVTVNEIAGAGTGDTTSNLATTTHYDALGRSDYTIDPQG